MSVLLLKEDSDKQDRDEMVTKNPKIGLRHKCKTEIPTGSNQVFFSISE